MANDPTTTNRLLTFLNKLKNAEDLIQKLDKIQPSKILATNGPKDYGLGETISQRIFEYRDKLPARRFSNLDQLEDIKGFGPDKLHELTKKVCIPAAMAFKNSMYANLIAENWILEPYTYHIVNTAEFSETVENESIFADFVCDKLEDISLQKYNNGKAAMLAAQLLKCCYLESFEDTHYGSIAFAFWFYQFDADNWFSFEQIWAECEDYLAAYSGIQHRLELRMFKGFDNAGVLANPVTNMDLPVVVNYAEQAVTIWTCQLND